MHAPYVRRPLALLLGWVIAGCSSFEDNAGVEGTGGGEGASLLGDVDTESYCNTVGIIEVRLRARRIGCDPDDTGPCTVPSDPPSILGDRASCPIAQTPLRMGVDVMDPGVYQVESAGIFTTAEERVDCFAPQGTPAGGSPDVPVRAADIDARAQIVLQAGPGPCPDP